MNIWLIFFLLLSDFLSLTSVRCLSFDHIQVYSRFSITVVKSRVTRQHECNSQRLVHSWNINPLVLLHFTPVFAPCWNIWSSNIMRTVQSDSGPLWSNKSGCSCTQQTKQAEVRHKNITHNQEKVSGDFLRIKIIIINNNLKYLLSSFILIICVKKTVMNIFSSFTFIY